MKFSVDNQSKMVIDPACYSAFMVNPNGGEPIRMAKGPDIIGDVAAFHEKFGLAYNGPARVLPDDLHSFRSNFHSEEKMEYDDERYLILQALIHGVDQSKDSGPIHMTPQQVDEFIQTRLHKQIDAIVDLVYVAIGTGLLQFGEERMREAWNRVQPKNMAKERKLSAGDGHTDSGREAKYDVVKPEGWTEPDHRDLMIGWVDDRI